MPGTNSSQQNPTAIHQAISFVADEAKNAPFAAQLDKMQALANGLQLCIELIETSETAKECGMTPTLGNFDTGRMMRLAVATSGILATMVDDHLAAINRNAIEAAKGRQP